MSDTTMPASPSEKPVGDFLGHPKGLVVLFFAEMWERFSYYGMRALLIFYLTDFFLFSNEKSYVIYGAYTSLVYLAPVLGGALADRYLGARKAVTLGAILLVFGHVGMGLEDIIKVVSGAVGSEIHLSRDVSLQIFYLALAFIIAGSGFLKANISTIVGNLYAKDDPRRDSGFTIFYMGINIGAFSASLLCGYLGETYGWAYGFGLAGLGMIFGLIVFLKWQYLLQGLAEPRNPELLAKKVFSGFNVERIIYLGAFFAVAVFWVLVQNQEVVGKMLGVFGALVLAIILGYAFFKCEPAARDRMLVATVLIFMSVLFWALFEQAGSSLNVLARDSVDRMVFGFEVRASQLQSLNALFIFTLAPFFSIMWVWLARKGYEPNTPIKFSLGILQVGLGYLVLVYGASLAGPGESIALIWLVALYLLHTTGELCLSPVGLSMITKLSVARMVGFMMGAWFLASAGANFIAGQIARVTGGEGADGETGVAVVMGVYENVGLVAVGVAVALAVLSPILKKGMHGVH